MFLEDNGRCLLCCPICWSGEIKSALPSVFVGQQSSSVMSLDSVDGIDVSEGDDADGFGFTKKRE